MDVADRLKPVPTPRVLTIEEFATELKVSEAFVNRIIRDGRFERAGGRVIRLGRNLKRIPSSVVDEIESGVIDLGDIDG